MSEPVIAARSPIAAELEEGKEYSWCACGLSNNQSFCDGSHKVTEFTPLGFTAQETGEAWLCRCKRSGNKPYCDGTHKRLDDAGSVKGAAPVQEGRQPTAEPTPEEPTVVRIHDLAKHGLTRTGHHGEMVAMGVPRHTLPHWDDIQVLTAQLDTKPLPDDAEVDTELVVGRNARRPLSLAMPIIVSDMSFGALSQEAKTALARGAEKGGTGICSGEGGMLPEEQQENSRYLYELASARFGYEEALLEKVQAFHFKGGKARRPALAVICPPLRSPPRSLRYAAFPRGNLRFPRPVSQISTRPTTFGVLPIACESYPAGSPSGLRSRPTTSRRTSISRWKSAWTTSFWMVGAERLVPRHESSATISRCQPFRPLRGQGGIWTAVEEVRSRCS